MFFFKTVLCPHALTPVRAFEYAAQTIEAVGHQGVMASLLHADETAREIEACNEVLTELMQLFNVRFLLLGVDVLTGLVNPGQLEEIVNVAHRQRGFETARVRDHEELLRHIESENAAMTRELVQQGTTISAVYSMVQVLQKSPHPFPSAWH